MSLKQYEPQVRIIGVTTPVVDFIPDSEGIISYSARVSAPKNQENFETADRLLTYCAKHSHWSVFEMSNAVIEIKAPRDISRQVLRHKSAAFQEFCVDGKTLVTTLTKSGKSRKVPIEDLYKRYKSNYWSRSDNLVRVYDEDTLTFKSVKIKEVFDTGKKPVYELKLGNGKSIVATKDHKVYTEGGFKRIADISVGDFVGCNGLPCYQNYDWLLKTKNDSIKFGLGLEYIAEKAGVSYHTIRKWLKKLGLSYTKTEVAKYKKVWNKNLPKELQPMYNRSHSKETIAKMRESSKKGEESNLWTGGESSWRKQVAYHCVKYKKELFEKQKGVCAISGRTISLVDSEVDHIEPVYKAPSKAFDVSNLQLLSKESHAHKTKKENADKYQSIRYSDVVSVDFVGETQTYDLEVDHHSHNYVANGIVTHNSQRYAEVDEQMFVLREARLQDSKNRQNSIPIENDELQKAWEERQKIVILEATEAYQWAIKQGIAKECARVVLPEGLTMSNMYMNATMRTWLHYCGLRSGNGTQLEHIWLAEKCREVLKDYFPNLVKFMENN